MIVVIWPSFSRLLLQGRNGITGSDFAEGRCGHREGLFQGLVQSFFSSFLFIFRKLKVSGEKFLNGVCSCSFPQYGSGVRRSPMLLSSSV